MKTPAKVSKALQEVWDWKAAAYREVAHLPFRQALRKRREDSERTAQALGFEPIHTARPRVVAESAAKYRVPQKKRTPR